jgi:hypothetical protein
MKSARVLLFSYIVILMWLYAFDSITAKGLKIFVSLRSVYGCKCPLSVKSADLIESQ